jgi:hypothetical protein
VAEEHEVGSGARGVVGFGGVRVGEVKVCRTACTIAKCLVGSPIRQHRYMIFGGVRGGTYL